MRLLIDNHIGSLVVVDESENPVGIITERDIFHLAFRYRGDMMDMKVGDTMTSRLVLGAPEDDIEKAAKVMTDEHIRHLPILDEQEQLCGIVSIGDIVKARLGEMTP
jgi:CBS domain-containing protein